MRRPALSSAARKARRARATREKRLINDFIPPEGVPLKFEVAGLGMRFGAQLLDILITVLFTGALVALLAIIGLDWDFLVIVWSLMFFFIRAPYYILTEILWNGQTLGKRITRIRVVGADGRSLPAYAIAVRNIMKEVEVFYPGTLLFAAENLPPFELIITIVWISILLAVPLMNKKRQRLGDMIANTYVIHQPAAVLMPDISTRAQAQPQQDTRFPFLSHQLDHYGAFELQTLERVLHVDANKFTPDARTRHRANLQKIAEKIIIKIDYTEKVKRDDIPQFLEAFYLAQRRYLENRKLFGDAREDKFHQEDKTEARP
ncbi:MAG: RDD family protein [Pseudomonadota bacterium]